MDALTFGSNILLRRLTFKETKKLPVQEIHLSKLLNELELNQDEVLYNESLVCFVDTDI